MSKVISIDRESDATIEQAMQRQLAVDAREKTRAVLERERLRHSIPKIVTRTKVGYLAVSGMLYSYIDYPRLEADLKRLRCVNTGRERRAA